MIQSLEAGNHPSLDQLHALTMSLSLGDCLVVLIWLEKGNHLTGKALPGTFAKFLSTTVYHF
jgi:hypothetical protein